MSAALGQNATATSNLAAMVAVFALVVAVHGSVLLTVRRTVPALPRRPRKPS